MRWGLYGKELFPPAASAAVALEHPCCPVSPDPMRAKGVAVMSCTKKNIKLG